MVLMSFKKTIVFKRQCIEDLNGSCLQTRQTPSYKSGLGPEKLVTC